MIAQGDRVAGVRSTGNDAQIRKTSSASFREWRVRRTARCDSRQAEPRSRRRGFSQRGRSPTPRRSALCQRDVLDDKDPLFFYSHAAALAVLGRRGPFLLDVVWLTVAAASTVLLLRAIGASWLTTAVGFVAYPLLLTGAWYYSDYSMLAGLAFAPLIGWLWISGRFALAGALFGVGLLFKVNLALVLASAPLAFLLLRLPAGSVRVQVARAAAGFGAVVAAAAAILALRGELHGYLENLINNVAYSRNVLRATGHLTGIIGHIKVAAGATGKPVHFAVVAAAFLVTGLLAIRTLRHVEWISGQPFPDQFGMDLIARARASAAHRLTRAAWRLGVFPKQRQSGILAPSKAPVRRSSGTEPRHGGGRGHWGRKDQCAGFARYQSCAWCYRLRWQRKRWDRG